MPRRAQEVARYRHLCRLHTVHTFMNNISESRKDLLASTGFGAFTLICKWIRIPSEFIRWVSDNFEPEKCQIRLSKYQVLPITCQDIQTVYDLLNERTKVNQFKCKQDSVERLRKDFKWKSKVKNIYRAKVEDLERVITNAKITNAKTDKIWCKAMILYLFGCFLCPDKNETVSLKYAFILEDLNDVSKYNSCKYVLKHLRDGTKGLVYPKSDMHFVMIHYIERMGRESRYSQGSTMPTLQGWDTTKVLKKMDTIGKHFGFGASITSGYALSPEINLESPMSLVPLEADECPLEKDYVSYLNQITRTRSIDTSHNSKFQDVLEKIDETSPGEDIYTQVFGKEHPGCVRGMRFGITPTQDLSSGSRNGSSTMSSGSPTAADYDRLNLELQASNTRVQALEGEVAKVRNK